MLADLGNVATISPEACKQMYTKEQYLNLNGGYADFVRAYSYNIT